MIRENDSIDWTNGAQVPTETYKKAIDTTLPSGAEIVEAGEVKPEDTTRVFTGNWIMQPSGEPRALVEGEAEPILRIGPDPHHVPDDRTLTVRTVTIEENGSGTEVTLRLTPLPGEPAEARTKTVKPSFQLIRVRE